MDTPEPISSELAEPIWAISWYNSTWPRENGITYANAETARHTAERDYPGVEFTIVTFEAAQRQQKRYEQNSTTV